MTRIKKAFLLTMLALLCVFAFAACGGEDTYTLTLDKQGGTQGNDSVTVAYGLDMREAAAPTRTGYTFLGYYDATTGGTQYYAADMTSAKPWDKPKNTTLYARWEANTYTVTFAKQGGTGGSDSVRATYDSLLPDAAAPERTTHSFGGYFSDSGGTGDKYYNSDMSSAKAWNIPNDAPLYAFWIAISWNAAGSGTLQDPYTIYNAPQLISLASASQSNSFSGIYFVLADNIDLGGMEWTPIGAAAYPFNGIFDGKGYAISNFKITNALFDAGLFGTSKNAILNLGIKSFLINTGSSVAGGLVAYNQGAITNCYAIDMSISSAGSSAGGLAGYNSPLGTITNCYAAGSISVNSSATASAGGLVGNNSSGTITNCYAACNVSIAASNVAHAGGLAGSNSGAIISCYATGNVSAYEGDDVSAYESDYAGGLAGDNFGTISKSYATGNVSVVTFGNAHAGGLIGGNSRTISKSYATGNVNVAASESSYAGGLAGSNSVSGTISGIIANCYATGDVSVVTNPGFAYAGGLVGLNSYAAITNCYATGDVSAAASVSYHLAMAGGLVGRNTDSVIRNCYATGDVSATASISTPQHAYAGGLLGFYSGDGIIINSYRYTGQTIKVNDTLESTNTEGIACTISELNTASFYTDTLEWDIDIWDFSGLDFENGKFPRLK